MRTMQNYDAKYTYLQCVVCKTMMRTTINYRLTMHHTSENYNCITLLHYILPSDPYHIL